MKVNVVNYTGYGSYEELDDIRVRDGNAIMSIDGSTSTTGISILNMDTKGLLARMNIVRDDMTESPVRYKIKLKQLVLSIIKQNPLIKYISYEEPCIYHKSAIKNLFMLRSFIEEMIIENEPELNYLRHFEVANTRWKKIFLYPEKMSNNTEQDKARVNEKVKKIYSLWGDLDLNESDAIGLGYATLEILRGEKNFELESTAFKYNIEFEDEPETDFVIEHILDEECEYKIPKKLYENGIKIKDLGDREKLDDKIYSELQNEDCILLLSFKSKKHGDIAMKYGLTGNSDIMHAIVWRKTRKKIKEW